MFDRLIKGLVALFLKPQSPEPHLRANPRPPTPTDSSKPISAAITDVAGMVAQLGAAGPIDESDLEDLDRRIALCRSLLNRAELSHDARTAIELNTLLADALLRTGDRRGDVSALARAFDLYRQQLSDDLPASAPARDPIALRVKLADAQSRLGELNGDKAQLDEGIATYRLALQGQPRARDAMA